MRLRLSAGVAKTLAVRAASVAGLLLCGFLLGGVFFPVTTGSSGARKVAQVNEGGIPCIVHQTWKSRRLPSARAQRWRDSWTRCLPECRHILWTDEDNRRLIGMHLPWLLPTYECFKSGVQRSDLAKYAYLFHYGGIYADLDTVCLRDFRPLLHSSGLLFSSMDGSWMRSVNGSYVQNSMMASKPKHKFWLALLKRIVAMHRQSRASGPQPPESTTGSLVLMEELQQYLNDGRTDVSIFPPRYFNPFSWITGGGSGKEKSANCKTMGGMTEDQEAECVAAFPGAYVMHMHCKSWGDGRI